MTILYTYLLNPRRAMTLFFDHKRLSPTLWVLFFLAFLFPGNLFYGEILGHFFWMLGLAFMFFAQSMVVDFLAQILGYQHNSFTVFKWLVFSWLPLCLSVPIHNLGLQSPFTSMSLMFAVLYLQMMTIKRAYQVKEVSKWILLLTPYLLVLVIPVILLILLLMAVFL